MTHPYDWDDVDYVYMRNYDEYNDELAIWISSSPPLSHYSIPSSIITVRELIDKLLDVEDNDIPIHFIDGMAHYSEGDDFKYCRLTKIEEYDNGLVVFEFKRN